MITLSQLPYRFPKWTLLSLLLVTIVLAGGIPKLEQRNSFAGELPASDSINVFIEQVKADFGERSVVLVGLHTDDIYNAATAEKIIALSEAIKGIPYVLSDEIYSLATVQNVSDRSWGVSTGAFLDPMPNTDEEWQQLRQDIAGNDIVIDKLVSNNGQLAVVVASLADGFEGGEVYDSLQVLAADFTGPEKIHISGAPILVEDVQRGISGDSRRFIPIAIVLIFIGFFLCFRRLAGVLLPVSMVIVSIVWTMGAMGYLGLPVTVVSNALPVIMVAVASSYGIHFMNTYFDLADQQENALSLTKATLATIGRPILITGFTSALGSASLLVFNITSLQEFGLIGAIGFLFATIICLSLLPAACTLLPIPKGARRESHWLNRKLFQLTHWARERRYWVGGGYLLLLPLCVYWASTIKIGDDYIKFFPKDHNGRLAAETFNDNLSGVRVMDIVVDATPYGDIKTPAFYEAFTAFQAHLNSWDDVGSTYSYYNVVNHLQAVMQTDNTTEQLSTEELSQYLLLHEMSATPGEVFSLRTENYNKAKLQLFLPSSNPEDHEILYHRIMEIAPVFFTEGSNQLAFGGDVMHRIALGSYIVQGKVLNIIVALLIVLLCCGLIFRNIRRALLTLLPIVASLIMVFGGMGLVGIRLGISTSLLTAMIVGIGIDFAVHYLVAYFTAREEHSHNSALSTTSLHTGKAIAYDAISNIIGFSILSFSGFLPVQHFGWLLALSMLLIFINTMVLYPSVLVAKEEKKQPDIQLSFG